MTDVARMAGVSTATVSYVVSGSGGRANRISEETAARVQAAILELDYEPNSSARALRTRRTNTILFAMNRLTSLYSQGLAASIANELAPSGLSLTIDIGVKEDDIRRAVAQLDRNQADGLIIESGNRYFDLLRDATKRGHAIVAIGPGEPEPSFDVITHGNLDAIRRAMNLVGGRDDATFILLSHAPLTDLDPRTQIAQTALHEMGVDDSRIEIRQCLHAHTDGFDLAMRLLPGHPTPAVIYAGSDVAAIGILWACIQLGLRVPEDVAIIGHGNNPEAAITSPPLTSIGPVRNEIPRVAEFMISRLRDPTLPGRHAIEPWELYIRQST